MSPAQATRRGERIQMLQLRREGVTSSVIAWFLNRHVSTVRRWQHHFEKGMDLTDKPRSGRPPTYPAAAQYRVLSFYCQACPLPGYSSWNLRTARKYLAENPQILNCSPSHSTLQRILSNHALAPHRRKYFLQIRDPDFFPKMEHILPFLLHPPELFFLFDECPNLQALQRKDPPLPPKNGKPAYTGHDYIRRGTTDLMMFLQMKTGLGFGQCTPDHTTQTLIRVFKKHVRRQPSDSQLFYLMDNLSPHFNHQFCCAVAQLSGEDYVPLKTGALRRSWLQSRDKRIVVLFTPFHGSWLNPIEIWFGILHRHCLRGKDFLSVRHLMETIYLFIGTWNDQFCHPFNWSYDGEGLHAKAVRRFTQFLYLQSPTMDSKFLSDELFLMCNLAHNYTDRVAQEDWIQLRESFAQRQPFISKILENEPGPKRRDRLINAISFFNNIAWN